MAEIAVVILTVVAALSWVRYRWAVGILPVFLPLYLIRFTVGGIPTTLLEAAVVAVALVGILQPQVRRMWLVALHQLPRTVVMLIVAFVAACVLSVLVSPHLVTSLGVLKGWVLSPLLFGWVVYTVAGDPRTRNLFIYTLLATGVFVAGIGLSQIGLQNRITSIYDVPNSLALFLAPLIVIAYWLSKGSALAHKFAWAAALVMSAALLATQSIGGIASVIAALFLGVLLFSSGKKKRMQLLTLGTICVLAVSILIAAGKIPYLLQSLYSPDTSTSATVRLQLWSISWDLIKDHSLLGVGLGTFEPAYQQKLHERFQEFENSLKIENWKLKIQTQPLAEFVFRDPHNWILSFWLNTGLLGLVSFASIHVYLISIVLRHPYQLPITNYHVPAVFLALITLLLFGLVDTIYWKNDLASIQWALLALLIATAKSRSET